jgi:hypothetical protein
MNQRREDRFNKKLMVKICSGILKAWGVLKDISASGLLIKTNHKFNPDTPIDIEVMMPDGETATIKGIVRRIMITPNENRKFSIGIEIIEKNMIYRAFVKDIANKEVQTENALTH